MFITRRRLLNCALGGGIAGWLAAVMYPVMKYLIPPEQTEADPDTLHIGKVEDFPPKMSKIVKFGKKPVLVIRTEAGHFSALAATCTHLDCLVQYRPDMDAIWCACHNGKYDLSGRNISGPPPKPLQPYTVKVVAGGVFVGKPA